MRTHSRFALALALALLPEAAAAPPSKAKKPPAPAQPIPAADEFLIAATALTLQQEYDDAEKVVRKGQALHPDAHGFHLKLGDILVGRRRPAEAFYEYQWELLRAGDQPSGLVAAKEIGKLFTDVDLRGPEVEELRTVMLASSQVITNPKAAIEALESVQKLRGPRVALRLYLAEAKHQLRQHDAAAAIYRSLIAEDPRLVPAYVELAGVLRVQGKTGEAEALDAKARAIDANHPSLRQPLPPSSGPTLELAPPPASP